MSNGNGLAVIENSTALQGYGSRDEVSEITDRLMMMHPEAKKIGISGMRAVAQLAVMMGANPLPTAGEIYAWVDWQGNMSTMLGIAYYRRKAREKDTVIWLSGNEPRPMTKEERDYYNVPGDALAGICKGFLLSEYERLLATGTPWQAAQQMLARTGTAVTIASEMFFADTKTNRDKNRVGKPSPPPAGRTWQWVADKRAEIDFYRIKSLVDTTLTDAMQGHAELALRAVGAQRPSAKISELVDSKPEGEWNAVFFDAHESEPPVVYEDVEWEEEEPEPQAELASVEFAKGDTVLVSGNHSESLGEFVKYHLDDMAIVSISGKELKVYLNRVKAGPPPQLTQQASFDSLPSASGAFDSE